MGGAANVMTATQRHHGWYLSLPAMATAGEKSATGSKPAHHMRL